MEKIKIQKWEESEKIKENQIQKIKYQKKEIPDIWKITRKITKHYIFPIIYSSGGSKSKLTKAAGTEPTDQIKDKKLRTVVRRKKFQITIYKISQFRIILKNYDAEKNISGYNINNILNLIYRKYIIFGKQFKN